MKQQNYTLIRYDADEGMVFDWKEPRYIEETDDEGNVINTIQEHLYVKTLFIGETDSIDNYIEVPAPVIQ
jgi:hypothetical protein